jgi:hypothetical protein
MSSPTSGAVHRTGPVPVALDYSKPLIQALAADGDDRLPIGPVSRAQLLLSCMVERLHDAIYVMPRQARDPQSTPVDPEEYAKDVGLALKALQRFANELPDDSHDPTTEIEELNNRIQELRGENRAMLDEAKQVREYVSQLIDSNFK